MFYLQDNIAGRSVIDAHFGRHHHQVILSDVEARWAQAISAKQKFKKIFCITTYVSRVIIRLNYWCFRSSIAFLPDITPALFFSSLFFFLIIYLR